MIDPSLSVFISAYFRNGRNFSYPTFSESSLTFYNIQDGTVYWLKLNLKIKNHGLLDCIFRLKFVELTLTPFYFKTLHDQFHSVFFERLMLMQSASWVPIYCYCNLLCYHYRKLLHEYNHKFRTVQSLCQTPLQSLLQTHSQFRSQAPTLLLSQASGVIQNISTISFNSVEITSFFFLEWCTCFVAALYWK